LPAAETLDTSAALDICRTLIEAHADSTSNQGCHAAMALLPTMQRVHQGQNDLAAFDAYLAQLRQDYRATRDVMAF